MNPSFREWLAGRGLDQSTVTKQLGEVKRLEEHYGDLDKLYDEDRFAAALDNLKYSKDDERQERPNPTGIQIEGKLYHTLQKFRTALNAYSDFREAMRKTVPVHDVWDRYLEQAKQIIDDGTLDRDERYKDDLGDAVSTARSAVLADSEDWSQLLKRAIAHPKNNLIDKRVYPGSKESKRERLVRWMDQSPEDVRLALLKLWTPEDREVGERIRAFDDSLPEDVFSKGSRSPRLDAATYLMMGLDKEQFPPYRQSRFRKTYTWLGYPKPPTDDMGDEYEHALLFLDNLMAEAEKRGMERPSTRLDAQSVVWSLSDKLEGSGMRGSESMTQPFTPVSSHELNTILYGPPGTGKTYTTVRRCVEICDGKSLVQADDDDLRSRYRALMKDGRIEFVTFHQSYGYEEFVEGLRPVAVNEGGMRLDVVDGVLKRIAERAREHSGNGELDGARSHVLVIDEINRANISRVMGELITILEDDKRDGAKNEVKVTLPYSGVQFTLPKNLYILGTMNTADRSIALLDTALRRRFHFEEMAPRPDLLKGAAKDTGINLPSVLRAMNERLEYLVDRDHLIGHAWFMDVKKPDDVHTVMRRKIIPLLAEYFYDDWSKVQAVLGGTSAFVKGKRLTDPQDPDSDLGEERFRWIVRETFPKDAYDQLVRTAVRNETAE